MYVLYMLNADINECLSAPCRNGGACVDDVNSYTCQCLFDYTGSECKTRKYTVFTCRIFPNLGAVCKVKFFIAVKKFCVVFVVRVHSR